MRKDTATELELIMDPRCFDYYCYNGDGKSICTILRLVRWRFSHSPNLEIEATWLGSHPLPRLLLMALFAMGEFSKAFLGEISRGRSVRAYDQTVDKSLSRSALIIAI